mgnify:CR=1 FL=1
MVWLSIGAFLLGIVIVLTLVFKSQYISESSDKTLTLDQVVIMNLGWILVLYAVVEWMNIYYAK